jgi:dystonin
MQVFEDDLHRSCAPAYESCKDTAHQLLEMISESERPEVQQSIGALDERMSTVTALCTRRHANLIEAMERAMAVHALIEQLRAWLQSAEKRTGDWTTQPAVTSLDEIYEQMAVLQTFRTEMDSRAIDKEVLASSASELLEGTTPAQASGVREPVREINRRWSALNGVVNGRQQRLERALLDMGQFQTAYDQLIEWMSKTQSMLDDIQPNAADSRANEIECARHKVIENDVGAHEPSVSSLQQAAKRMQDKENDGADDETIKKMAVFDTRWTKLKNSLADKLAALTAANEEAASFGGDLDRWIDWLNETYQSVTAARPTGGLPETAQQQLDEFLVGL